MITDDNDGMKPKKRNKSKCVSYLLSQDAHHYLSKCPYKVITNKPNCH